MARPNSNRVRFSLNNFQRQRGCLHKNKEKFNELILCTDCGKVLNDSIETEKKQKEWRKRLCKEGKHHFVHVGAEVYCEFCGEVKENIGFSSISSGGSTLKKGQFSDHVWKH